MSNCVIRFGGTSLSKFPVLEAFASLLSESVNDDIVVVSAIPELQKTIEQGLDLLTSNAANSDLIISQINNTIYQKLLIFQQSVPDENLQKELTTLHNLLKGIE